MSQTVSRRGTDGSTDGANGPTTGPRSTVTFEGTFDDVKDLADAIQNDPSNDGRFDRSTEDVDGTRTTGTPDIDPGTDPSSNSQIAQAGAASAQRNAGNANMSARVHQPGNTGAVTQTNAVVAEAQAKTSSNTGFRHGRDTHQTRRLGHRRRVAGRGEQHQRQRPRGQRRRHRGRRRRATASTPARRRPARRSGTDRSGTAPARTAAPRSGPPATAGPRRPPVRSTAGDRRPSATRTRRQRRAARATST